METAVLMALGGAFGGMARFFVAGLVARRVGSFFPWGTLVVNVTGACLIGAAAAAAADGHPWLETPQQWELAVTGVLGAYTTVSSFSLQTLTLVHDRRFYAAIANVLLAFTLCLAAVAAGFLAGVAALR